MDRRNPSRWDAFTADERAVICDAVGGRCQSDCPQYTGLECKETQDRFDAVARRLCDELEPYSFEKSDEFEADRAKETELIQASIARRRDKEQKRTKKQESAGVYERTATIPRAPGSKLPNVLNYSEVEWGVYKPVGMARTEDV